MRRLLYGMVAVALVVAAACASPAPAVEKAPAPLAPVVADPCPDGT